MFALAAFVKLTNFSNILAPPSTIFKFNARRYFTIDGLRLVPDTNPYPPYLSRKLSKGTDYLSNNSSAVRSANTSIDMFALTIITLNHYNRMIYITKAIDWIKSIFIWIMSLVAKQ